MSRPAPAVDRSLGLHERSPGIDPVRFDRLTGFRSLANEEGFLVAQPSAIGEIWIDGRDSRRGDPPDDVSSAEVDRLAADRSGLPPELRPMAGFRCAK